jgi:hypothetical protein
MAEKMKYLCIPPTFLCLWPFQNKTFKSKPLKAQWEQYVPPVLTIINGAFCE